MFVKKNKNYIKCVLVFKSKINYVLKIKSYKTSINLNWFDI